MSNLIKRILLIMSALICFTTVSARRLVRGTVYDALNEPLVGVTVCVAENPSLGAVTDIDGHFRLFLDEKQYTLKVSYIGYVTQKFKVSATGDKSVKVYLKEEQMLIDQVVVTGTRTPKLLKDAPIVTKVISSDALSKINATDISDVLANEIPGVEFTYAMNQQKTINFQGYGGNAVLFLVDGERMAGETLNNIDFERIGTGNVKRVEIVKGASSTLYGSNAIGGVINIITGETKKDFTSTFGAKAGSHGERLVNISGGFRKGKWNNTLTTSYHGMDKISLPNPGNITELPGGTTCNVNDKIVWNASDKMKLTARAGYFYREKNHDGLNDRNHSYNAGLRGTFELSDEDHLEAGMVYDRYDKNNQKEMWNEDDGFYKEVETYRNKQNSARVMYAHTFEGKHILTLGGDYMHDYLSTYQFTDGSKKQFSMDAFSQFDWNPTKKFNITAGLRYDYYSEADVQRFTPCLGAMYKIGHCSVRGSYASGFRAPTLKEMYMDFDMVGLFSIHGNENLKPETSNHYTLSVEYLQKRYNVTVTGYYSDIKNSISTVSINNDGLLDDKRYENLNHVRMAGADASVSARYPNGINWSAAYSYVHEKLDEKEVSYISTRPHAFSSKVGFEKSWKRYNFSVDLRTNWKSGVKFSIVDPEGNFSDSGYSPAYWMMNLMTNHTFDNRYTLSLAIDNLLGYKPKYYYNNSPVTTGTTFMVGLNVRI